MSAFSTTTQTSFRQCGTFLTFDRKKQQPIIIGETLPLLSLRDRKLASEKYTTEVVRQNKVGGGHNLIGSSTPFCKFQAFPLFLRKRK